MPLVLNSDGIGSPPRDPPVALFTFDGSNAGLTARLMLDHKGIDYRYVNLLPAAHALAVRALGFPGWTVPALKVGGRRVQGTRNISRALDELWPEPLLFPSARRDAVEEAERWGEDVQNAARRLFYCAARRDRSAFASMTEGTHTLPARLWLRAAAPLIVWLAGSVHAATDSAGRDALAALPSVLDTIDAWIEEGLLDGSELNAADFQIAPNVRPMLFFEDLAAFIEARPAGRFARRVVPEYPGHVRRVLPDEWLEPLRAASEGRS
jgi:glutathione S-transferase